MRVLMALLLAIPALAQFRAGVAKVNLDPPLGIPMAGYSVRYSTGTLDPVEARVLAMSDGTRTVALVTLDLCYVFEPPVMEEIRAGVRGAPANVDEVIFHASHTHSGPTYAASPESSISPPHRLPRRLVESRASPPPEPRRMWGRSACAKREKSLHRPSRVSDFESRPSPADRRCSRDPG